MAKDVSWDLLLYKLKRLKSEGAFASAVEDILREWEEDIVQYRDIDGWVCSRYGEVGTYHATQREYYEALYALQTCSGCPYHKIGEVEVEVDEEDSMFLLSV